MDVTLEPIEGKYEILEKLHEGGMGSIYKVRHRLLDTVRVIKTMRPQLADDDEFKARFLREAKVAISLDHPNIAKLFDFSIAGAGMAFIVMEYISGLSLRQILHGMGPPELPLSLEVSCQTLDALGFLHRQGYVHRDVAPDNVMLTTDVDDQPTVKLIDLGIAKSLTGSDDLTTAGQFLGKARYSSPEHFSEKGATGADARSDVYSFGVVLYELLTGRTPIIGSDLRSLSAGHLYRPPMPFEESDPAGNVPDDLREIVMRALAKDPDERFPDSTVFREALDHVRLRYPMRALDLAEVFDQIRTSTEVVRSYTSAGTQIELDKQFGREEATPTHGGLVGPQEERVVGLDLPAPEAVLAKFDELAGDPSPETSSEVAEPTELQAGSHTIAVPADDGMTLAVPLAGLDIEPPTATSQEQGDLSRTMLVDPDELARTQRVKIDDVESPPDPPPSDADDYRTESTYLPPLPVQEAESVEPPAAADVEPPPPPVARVESQVSERAEVAANSKPPTPRRPAEAAPGDSWLARLPVSPQILAAVGVVAVIAIGLLLWLGRSGDDSPAPEPTVETIRPTAPTEVPAAPAEIKEWMPADEVHPALVSGRRFLLEGQALGAVVALGQVESESLSLAPAELDLLANLRDGVDASLGLVDEGADPRSLGQRLVAALTDGPVTELRDVFDLVSTQRRENPESFEEDFAAFEEPIAQASEIVGEWRRMWRLKREEDHLGTVRSATKLAELYPLYATRSFAHRDEAAAVLESRADALSARGDLGTARARLAELREAYPGRPGLQQKIAVLERRLSEGREIEAVLSRAEGTLGAEPHRGLELLAQLSIPAGNRYADEVGSLREQLQRRLIELDRESPVVKELEGAEHRRNEAATIPLEISDDYHVENVRAWARARGATAFSEVSITRGSGNRWTIEVPVDVHDNKRRLEFHVWVADRSGNTTSLGTESEPRAVRRKGLF